jgi:NAD(P)-dependent dehydrogenase (short-subunit alcohol dehydrogenase family)
MKTAVVTGASNGIGLVTALELDRLGYRVLLVVRNRQKGQAVLERCKNAQMFVADLSLVRETLRVAEEIKVAAPQIDVLVNNAGAIFNQRLLTAEGLEMTFALNHMGYFALTAALMPHFAQGVRVVSVSSDAHRTGAIVWDDLQAGRKYDGFAAYCRSKAMNVLFSNELSRRLEGQGTSNALHPGVVATGFAAQSKGFIGTMFKLIRPLMVTPEKGAETMLYLASSPEVAGATGLYWSNSRPAKAAQAVLDQTAQKHLWLESERIVASL